MPNLCFNDKNQSHESTYQVRRNSTLSLIDCLIRVACNCSRASLWFLLFQVLICVWVCWFIWLMPVNRSYELLMEVFKTSISLESLQGYAKSWMEINELLLNRNKSRFWQVFHILTLKFTGIEFSILIHIAVRFFNIKPSCRTLLLASVKITDIYFVPRTRITLKNTS